MGKMILGILSILAILVLVFYLFFDFNDELEEQKELTELFKNSDLKESLYISTKFRGLNYQKSYLSSSKNTDENNSYVYNSHPIFIGKKSDTIFVYTYVKAVAPTNFNAKTIIKQVKLDNKSMMNLYDTYKSQDLVLIE